MEFLTLMQLVGQTMRNYEVDVTNLTYNPPPQKDKFH